MVPTLAKMMAGLPSGDEPLCSLPSAAAGEKMTARIPIASPSLQKNLCIAALFPQIITSTRVFCWSGPGTGLQKNKTLQVLRLEGLHPDFFTHSLSPDANRVGHSGQRARQVFWLPPRGRRLPINETVALCRCGYRTKACVRLKVTAAGPLPIPTGFPLAPMHGHLALSLLG